eukprot:1194908-Prorocentrum_minimum.AAC.8
MDDPTAGRAAQRARRGGHEFGPPAVRASVLAMLRKNLRLCCTRAHSQERIDIVWSESTHKVWTEAGLGKREYGSTQVCRRFLLQFRLSGIRRDESQYEKRPPLRRLACTRLGPHS